MNEAPQCSAITNTRSLVKLSDVTVFDSHFCLIAEDEDETSGTCESRERSSQPHKKPSTDLPGRWNYTGIYALQQDLPSIAKEIAAASFGAASACKGADFRKKQEPCEVREVREQCSTEWFFEQLCNEEQEHREVRDLCNEEQEPREVREAHEPREVSEQSTTEWFFEHLCNKV